MHTAYCVRTSRCRCIAAGVSRRRTLLPIAQQRQHRQQCENTDAGLLSASHSSIPYQVTRHCDTSLCSVTCSTILVTSLTFPYCTAYISCHSGRGNGWGGHYVTVSANGDIDSVSSDATKYCSTWLVPNMVDTGTQWLKQEEIPSITIVDGSADDGSPSSLSLRLVTPLASNGGGRTRLVSFLSIAECHAEDGQVCACFISVKTKKKIVFLYVTNDGRPVTRPRLFGTAPDTSSALSAQHRPWRGCCL